MIVTDEMMRAAMNAVPNAVIFRREMRAALEAALEARDRPTVDVIAEAREVIRPVSSAELIHTQRSDDWKLGFDTAAQAMAIEATRSVNVLASCIEDLANALRPFVDNFIGGGPPNQKLREDARATLARWGLEK